MQIPLTMDKLQETAVLLVVCIGLLLAASADLDCSNESEMLLLQQRCFTDQGIEIVLPTYSKDDTKVSHKKTYMDAVIAQKADLICAQQTEFQTALECAMRQTRSCMPPDYQGYLPEPSKMSQLVSTLCSTENKVEFECVRRKASDLFDCGTRRGQEEFGRRDVKHTMGSIVCKAFQFNAECQVTELRECGCHTVRAYEIVSRDLLYPPSCPPLPKRPRVQCQSANQFLFLDNAGGRVSEHIAFLLSVSVVFILCELFV